MPLGILGETAFEKSEITLSHGDIILIISDGAAVIPHITFKEIIQNNKNAAPEVLSEEIIQTALRMSISGKHDDITAVCIKIEETV